MKSPINIDNWRAACFHAWKEENNLFEIDEHLDTINFDVDVSMDLMDVDSDMFDSDFEYIVNSTLLLLTLH